MVGKFLLWLTRVVQTSKQKIIVNFAITKRYSCYYIFQCLRLKVSQISAKVIKIYLEQHGLVILQFNLEPLQIKLWLSWHNETETYSGFVA